MIIKNIRLPRKTYRYIFLVQNRDYWKTCPFPYDKKSDLVLTFDFAVAHDITSQGGVVEYLDHLVKTEVMEQYNHETYDFFKTWYYDRDKKDIFTYKGIEVGNAFRLEIWNDITYTARLLVNLLALKHIQYEKIFAGLEDKCARDILEQLDLKMIVWACESPGKYKEYFFPILLWMDQKVRPAGLKPSLKSFIKSLLDIVTRVAERLRRLKKNKIDLYIQPYHPTMQIIEHLKQDDNLSVIVETYTRTKGITKERRIPAHGSLSSYRHAALEMLARFQEQKTAYWEIEGIRISDILYEIISRRIKDVLPLCLRTVDNIISFFSRRQLKLMITISNLGVANCLMMNYCQSHKIPTYLIINGLLGNSYLDESKNAQWINSYGESIKNNYFAGMDNIVCLGDPRMDDYVNGIKPKIVNVDKPVILIGAAGFNNIDLNSYLAYEFVFLHDIMTACRELIKEGKKMSLIIKVRANGYLSQYAAFLAEYFPEIPVQLYDRVPMKQILSQADFYISFYSQTLFEASCLGIPALFYKRDTEIMDTPFDGKSELVTAFARDELVEKIRLFYEHDEVYDSFMSEKVMEKYVGPLDGHNLTRNKKFIYSLMDQ